MSAYVVAFDQVFFGGVSILWFFAIGKSEIAEITDYFDNFYCCNDYLITILY